MITILYILFVASCVVLIVAILLQPGKADAGALFSSAVSSAAFGPRGTQTILAKITIVAAAIFMLVALALSMPWVTGQRSVLQTVGEEPTASPQASPAATPSASPATQGEANTGAATQNNNAPIETKAPTSPANTGAQPAPSK